MTPPPTPEAVEAAMHCAINYKGGESPTEQHVRCIRYHKRDNENYIQASARILAAEVERLRCELGHAQEQLERIRSLCLGSGVGLRDDVWDVVK